MSEFQNPEAQRQAELAAIFNEIEDLDNKIYRRDEYEGKDFDDMKLQSGIEADYAKAYELMKGHPREITKLITDFIKGRTANYQEMAQEFGLPIEEVADMVIGDLLMAVEEIEDRDALVTETAQIIESQFPQILESEE